MATGRVENIIPASEKPHFNYEALPPGHIRAVEVLPGTLEDELRIAIAPQELKKCKGVYVALSYTWGDPSNPQDVKCHDGTMVPVTQNLYKALKAIRKEKTAGLFWIDQISINQRDLHERSEQVKLMGEIFSCAREVWVWLSEDVWMDKHLLSAVPSITQAAYRWFGRIKASGSTALLEDNDLHKISKRSWESISRVMMQPYWTRVWVIQELVKSPSTYVLMGGGTITWDAVEKIIVFMHGESVPSDILPPGMRRFTRPAQKMITMRLRLKTLGTSQAFTAVSRALGSQHMGRWSTSRWTLLDLVLKTWHFRATDPRDRIYAIANLLDSPVHTEWENVEPDYTVDFKSLLLRTFIEGLTQRPRPTLEPLFYVHPLSPANWPSWIPDPNASLVRPSDLSLFIPHYSSGGSGEAHVRRAPGRSHSLQFLARRIGDVSKFADFDGITVSRLREMDEAGATTETYDSFEETFLTRLGLAYWLFVEKCDTVLSREADIHFLRAFFCDLMFDKKQRITESDIGALTLLLPLLEFFGPPLAKGIPKPVQNHAMQAYRIVRQLRFCGVEAKKDQAGELSHSYPTMGWVQHGVTEGDEICVIHGFPFPMVIRHIGGSVYRFLGICFIYGFMDDKNTRMVGDEEFIIVD